MRLLTVKVIRAMWRNKKAYLACVIVMMMGITMYTSMSNVVVNLGEAVNRYYREYRLADVFATLDGMPENRAEMLMSIEGISEVNARLVTDVRVLIPDNDNTIRLRFIGVDPMANDTLNMYKIADGVGIADGQDIMVGTGFVEAHGLRLGDGISTVINSQNHTFNLCATVMSPEYVYAIPDISTIYADPNTFDIAYVDIRALENATGNVGVVNDLSFALAEGYTFDDVKEDLKYELESYGLRSLIPRKDQTSFSIMEMELTSISSMSQSMPFIFLIVAIFILYIMLRRLVEQERSILGTLKAFGFTNTEILLNYILYGAITGFFGGVLGILFGRAMSAYMFDLFVIFFKIPNIETIFPMRFIALGMAIALASGVAAGFAGAKGVLKLRPAEAMRPVAPPTIKETFLDRSHMVKAAFTSRGMISLRYIFRNKLRSVFILGSVSLSYAMMAVVFSMNLLLDQMLYDQFTKAQVYDFKVTLKTPQNYDRAVDAVNRLGDLREAEGICALPVIVRNEHLSRGMMITGIKSDSSLFNIIDEYYNTYRPPENGMLLTKALADKLNVKRNDVVTIESPMLGADEINIIVTDVVSQTFGAGGYMDIKAMADLAGTDVMVTSLIFNLEDAADRVGADRGAADRDGKVGAAADRSDTVRGATDRDGADRDDTVGANASSAYANIAADRDDTVGANAASANAASGVTNGGVANTASGGSNSSTVEGDISAINGGTIGANAASGVTSGGVANAASANAASANAASGVTSGGVANTASANAARDEIKAQLLSADNVVAFEDNAQTLNMYRELMSTYSFTFVFMGLMAVVIGFAVIYNISKVSLSERSRELATMRVLGMTVGETNEIIAFEHWILSIAGLIVGIPVTLGMRFALSNMIDMEMFVIPGRTAPGAFVWAALGCMCMVYLANIADKGAIRKFDLVEVLKERE